MSGLSQVRAVCLLLAIVVTAFGDLCAADRAAIKAPDGFVVTLFADDDLSHDIHCLTIDSRGRITVAGLTYIKILTDTDADGIADSAALFVEPPPTGVQGMFWHGNDLLVVAGEGLLRYRDRDGDDKADGPPDVLLKIKTGGEHHAHSIQRGPDGWWYLIAGNDTGVDAKYVTLPSSPIIAAATGDCARRRRRGAGVLPSPVRAGHPVRASPVVRGHPARA